MSYHTTLGAAATLTINAIKKPTCPPGTTPHWTKIGYVCGGAGGSSISIPTSANFSASASAGGSASASASSSASSPKPAPASSMAALLTSSGAQQLTDARKDYTVKPATTHAVTPRKDYTAQPPVAPDYEADAAAARAQAARATGMNWLPWALGAAGVVGIVWLARRRA